MLPRKPEASYPVDEVWHTGDYPVWINQTIEGLNRENYDELVVGLGSKVVQLANGITYAQLGEGASECEALVMFCPFANDVADNMLIRGEFVRRAAEASGVEDSRGKPLPLIVFGSPSGSQGLRLTKAQADELRTDLGYFADEHVKVIKQMGFKKVNLLGFSQGAAVALAAATQAGTSGLEVASLAVGDPPNVMGRGVLEITKDFMAENAHLKEDVMAGGVDAAVEAHGFVKSGWAASAINTWGLLDYAYKIVRQGRANLALAHALAMNDFSKMSEDFVGENPEAKYVAGFGTASTITPPDAIESAVKDVKHHFGVEAVKLIAIQGAHHSWGDNLPLLAKFFVSGLIK